MLVLRAEKSTRRAVQHASRTLQGVGGRLIGAIVNDVKRSKGRYGDGYGSGSGYGYGYGKKEKTNGRSDSLSREQGKTVPIGVGSRRSSEEGVEADGRVLG